MRRRGFTHAWRRYAGTLLIACAASCGGTPSDGGDDPTAFVAFARDFADFRGWPAKTMIGEASGAIHTAGMRTVYANKLPPSGQITFDQGTMIVKVVESGEIFAQAKRGGTYNMQGAVGWEWFELKETTAGLAIVWRGITPPLGACYGGIVGGACNDCHKAAVDNDFVFNTAVGLQ